MKPLRLDRFSFVKLSRRPVGHHPMDSGDAYGRNYQRPIKRLIEVKVSYNEHNEQSEFYVSASLPLGELLDRSVKFDAELTKELRKLDAHTLNSKDAAYAFAEARGELELFERGNWDNSYNRETDLDQGYQQYIYKNRNGDYLHFIETHNGCDIRGGYSQVVVATSDEGYIEESVSWHAVAAFSHGKEDEALLDEFQDRSGESLSYLIGNRKIKAATKVARDEARLILDDGSEVIVAATHSEFQ